MTSLPALDITPTTAPRGGKAVGLNNNRNNASHPRAGD